MDLVTNVSMQRYKSCFQKSRNLINEPFFPEPLSLPNDDLVLISQRPEQLTVDVNTHSIRLELESLKRQRLRRSLKQAKAKIIILNQTLTQQNHENATLREQMAMLSSTLFSELACLTKQTHCCLGRIHHLVIAVVPRIYMSEAEHNDLSQQALQLIGTVIYYEYR